MEQVDQSKYDRAYFEHVFKPIDYSKKVTAEDFRHVYRTIGDLVDFKTHEKLVDMGCGNGDLVFYLGSKYQPTIVGIDYSKDAIDICNENLANYKLQNLGAEKISFLNLNNNELVEIPDVDAVFFTDVLEHMYDKEIAFVMDQLKHWKRTSKLKILVHTDNNVYLRLVRPVIDLIAILSGKATFKSVQERNKWEKERHINLTNPWELKTQMESLGFKETKRLFPTPDVQTVKSQLGDLQKVPLLIAATVVVSKFLMFLMPSFYAVYTEK